MMRTWIRLVGLALAVGTLVLLLGGVNASCSQTPTNVPVRTFEIAQKLDTVCIQVNDENGNAIPQPVPVAQDNCGPVAIGVNGAALEYHLMAVVTQLGRGELAVVDLTAGTVIDEDKSTTGIQFITVGAIPTDVAVAPDTKMTFVSSADPDKPAIYGIDNRRLLGDSTGLGIAPLKLTDLFACALPQPPGNLTVTALPGGGYVLVAMLRPWAGQPAKVVSLDPTALLEGAGLDDAGTGVEAGSLTPCRVVGATVLSGSLPASWAAGPAWPDGVPYVDAGIQLADAEPSLGPGCTAPAVADGGIPLSAGPLSSPTPNAIAMRSDVPLLYISDGIVPVIHVIDLTDPTMPKEQPPLLATSVLVPSRQVSVGAIAVSPPTRDYRIYLYASDVNNGSLMVYDITDPSSTSRVPMLRPHPELNPFQPPDRIAFAAPVAAIAFAMHDWPLPSQTQGAEPVNESQGLLCNPSPNAHPDAGAFVTGDGGEGLGAYYRADQTGIIQAGSTVTTFPVRLRGIFGFATLTTGTIVTIDVDDWDAPCRRNDPMSYGFADAGTGGISGALDLPEPPASGPSDLDPYHVPEAYNPTIGESAATTLESFFPISAPHRLRSDFLLLNDPTLGNHAPAITGGTLLYDSTGAPLSTGNGGGPVQYPILLPTPLPAGYTDPTYVLNPSEPDPANRQLSPAFPVTTLPGQPNTPAPTVRLSYEDPTTFASQSWTVTYEGALPTVSGIALDISTTDGYSTLTLASGPAEADASFEPTTAPSPAFCSRGIEDWTLGQLRAQAVLDVINTANDGGAGLPQPGAGAAGSPTLGQWTSDYVELTDNLLLDVDGYWGEPSTPNASGLPPNDCWDPPLADPPDFSGPVSPLAEDRFNACSSSFGEWGEDAGTTPNETVADQNFGRDLPILQAFDDHLVLGRFGWLPQDSTGAPVAELPTNRVVVGPDPSNPPFLRFIRCCFHHQAAFKVRTGGEWLAVGSVNGLIHHIQADPATNRCVPTCSPNDVLKNARAPDVPWGTAPACTPPSSVPSLDRNSPLAMRNPMFSFVMWSGCTPLVSNDHSETTRDMQWKFSMTGGFVPVTISMTGGSNVAVSPQSMRFIDPLGQLAVVDGEQQGLILIDLNTLGFAHNPYY
jgi:hypothetical protein